VSLLVPQVPRVLQVPQVPQVANWGEPVGHESLTPDSDIDSGLFSQESGLTRVDTSDGESEEEQRKEKEEEDVEEGRREVGDEEDEGMPARPKTPFTRRIWNRQNGWYRVRTPGTTWSAASSTNQGRDLRAELEVMRREIAEMLDDTRELDERDNSDSRDCSETSEEDEEEQYRKVDNGDIYGEEEEEVEEVEEQEEEETEDDDEEEEGDRELYYDFESSDENDEVEEEGEFQTAAASY